MAKKKYTHADSAAAISTAIQSWKEDYPMTWGSAKNSTMEQLAIQSRANKIMKGPQSVTAKKRKVKTAPKKRAKATARRDKTRR
jgi:hypothetical protein